MNIFSLIKGFICRLLNNNMPIHNEDEAQQRTLTPIIIGRDEPQYCPVKEIGDKLGRDKNVKNIALTGPYGSGKSSVLLTLQNDYPHHKYLQISLATLESYDANSDENSQTVEEKKKNDSDRLNRLIEYSILQQLIYREKYSTLPNSRIKRIFHFNEWKLLSWTVGIVLFFIAYLVAFEPKWLRVEAMYRILDWGQTANLVCDILSVIYMIAFLFIGVRKVLMTFCGYRLGRLNLKNGEIELKEASIFNKHLDEIIYFFQRTDYNVVIIEDLDRFNTSDIYLKLRELNQLINASEEIKRNVVFIYAVKDDMFKDVQRTKFFDYISTVIPVINHSNSKAQLNRELQRCGYNNDIPDNDLDEIAFFIDDMRMLYNIVNEYQQYRNRLCSIGSTSLDPIKLLGMIVYKNYFPNDFALLHKRDGKIYQCIASKDKFVEYARQELKERKQNLKEKIDEYKKYNNISKKELRAACMLEIIANMHRYPVSINIDNEDRDVHTIVSNEELFEKMILSNTITYQSLERYYNGSNHPVGAIFDIDKGNLNFNKLYWDKKRSIEDLPDEIKQEQKNISEEEQQIKSAKLSELITRYNVSKCQDFSSLRLEPMMNIFLRRGYIDEDYFDYISYFYEDELTLNDRDLMLSMKQAIRSDFRFNINKVEKFVKKLPLYVFNDDAVLNNQLVDFLIEHRNIYPQKFDLLMKRIENSNPPIDFIAQYNLRSKSAELLYNRFIEYAPSENWSAVMSYPDDAERTNMIVGCLKFCTLTELPAKMQSWLNDNYDFLTSHSEFIGLKQVTEHLFENRKFNSVNSTSFDLLDFIIKNHSYALNSANLCLIVNYAGKVDNINADNLTLSRIRDINNPDIIAYVEDNLNLCLDIFSQTDNQENEEALLFIINSDDVEPEIKKRYLAQQQNRIQDIKHILDDYKDLAMELFLINPSWENVSAYFAFSESKISKLLILYVEHFNSELSNQPCADVVENKGSLFNVLLGSNVLTLKTFELLQKSFDCTIASCESLDGVEDDRLDILIDFGKVEYTQENTSSISSRRVSTFVKYLLHHKTEYLSEVESITYTAEIALCLLKSDSLNNKEKSLIVPLLAADTIAGNAELASAICFLLPLERIEMDKECLLAVVEGVKKLSEKIAMVKYTLAGNHNDIGLIESLLRLLPDDYSMIAEHDRKHPTLENTEYNVELVELLKNIGYISTYTVSEKRLRINKRIR